MMFTMVWVLILAAKLKLSKEIRYFHKEDVPPFLEAVKSSPGVDRYFQQCVVHDDWGGPLGPCNLVPTGLLLQPVVIRNKTRLYL